MPCRPAFFLPVRVLSRLFRRLFVKILVEAHEANSLKFFGNHAGLADKTAFAAFAEATDVAQFRLLLLQILNCCPPW